MIARSLPQALLGAIVLLAPFGGGGRAPASTLILHLLSLLLVLILVLRGLRAGFAEAEAGSRPVLALVAIGLLFALCSGLRAGYAYAAWLGWLDLLLPAGLFAAVLLSGADWTGLAAVRALAVGSTTLQALLAIARGWRGGAAAAGAAFENPNHLAAWIVIGLVLCAASAEAAWRRVERGAVLIWLGLALAHLAALAVLASRGAFLALGVSLAIFLLHRGTAWSRRARAVAALSLLLVASAGTAALAHRFGSARDPYRYHRLRIWEASLDMLADRPLLGFGPGLFKHSAGAYNFPLQDAPVRYGRTFDAAHSALLTTAVEIGAPGAGLLLAAACLSALLLLRGTAGSRVAGVHEGTGLALIALIVHASVDDLHHRPALLLVPALLAGIALAVGRGRDGVGDALRGNVSSSPGPARRRSGRGAAPAIAAVVLFACAAWGAVIAPYLADREARAARALGRDGLHRMERAARLNRLHPEYRHDLAMAMLNLGPVDASRYARAALLLEEARGLKPIDFRFPLLLARLEERVGRTLFGDETAARRATALYREAARLAPRDPRPLLELGGHLSEQGGTVEALEALDRALDLEPNLLRAHVLKVGLLLERGDRAEALEAFRRLEAASEGLAGYRPDSGYAREIVRLDAGSLEEVRRDLDPGGTAGDRSASH